MNVLLFDNYDSFTYNLVQIVRQEGARCEVIRNDKMPLEEARRFDKIILSPGPGIPQEAGLLLPLIQAYAVEKPMLGVCLGHQAIAEAFGGALFNLPEVFHGVASTITVTAEEPLFAGLGRQFQAGRYHSWAVEEKSLPSSLEITARDEDGAIMAFRHRQYNLRGVQFHPESVLTPQGRLIIRNFLNA